MEKWGNFMDETRPSRAKTGISNIKLSQKVATRLEGVEALLEQTAHRKYTKSEVVERLLDWSEPTIGEMRATASKLTELTRGRQPKYRSITA